MNPHLGREVSEEPSLSKQQLWAIEDIQMIAEQMGKEITEEQAVQLLASRTLHRASEIVSCYGMEVLEDTLADLLE